MPSLIMDPSDKARTNGQSKFSPFSLTLSNGSKLAGISHIPNGPFGARNKPLVIGLHGGTCTAHNYDVNPEYSASITSSALSVPFVAIDRPCYGGTGAFFPLSEDSSFYRETARWLHELIFPALWREFGIPNGCSGMVTTSHSMAVPPSIIAAAIYSDTSESERSYNLSGIILHGWGTRMKERDWSKMTIKDSVTYPSELKAEMMLSDRTLGCADYAALETLCDDQTVPMPLEELADGQSWASYSDDYVPKVKVPVMFANGEHDYMWEGTQEHLDELKAQFSSCPRFDGGVVLGAPHALEWAYVSQGWYARCFGWAMEVCAAQQPS